MAAPQKVLLSWMLPDATEPGQVFLDASINEQHGQQAQVTEHQVEKGANINDHIRPLPGKFTLEGMITNHPLALPETYTDGITGSVQNITVSLPGKPGQPAGTFTYQAFKFDGQVDRVREVFGDWIDAIQNAALWHIATTLATYDNYAVVNFAAPRNAQKGNVLHFTIDFQEVRFVDSQTVEALPGQAKHRGAKSGKQLDEKNPEDAKKISTIKAVATKLAAAFQ